MRINFHSAIKAKIFTLALLFMMFSSGDLVAQSNKKDKWQYQLSPYILFPNMKGTAGIGDLPDVTVDADAGDIFSHLQIGALLYFEASNAKWAITTDIIYMDLDQDITSNKLISSGKVGVKQFMWEQAALRKIKPWLEAGIGGRLNSLKAGVDIVQNNLGGGTTAKSRSVTKTWVDPILVGRVKLPLHDKWLLQFRGDLGGFGIGSDFTWQVQAGAYYRFSKLFHLGLEYRIMSVDYETGSGSERFLYDTDTFGPALKFGFNF